MSNKYCVNRLGHLNRVTHQANKSKHATSNLNIDHTRKKEKNNEKQLVIERMKRIQTNNSRISSQQGNKKKAL